MSKRILVLDDDLERIIAYQELLAGHLVDVCMHANECIALLKNNIYDVILLDHDLNGTQIDYDEDDCGSIVAEWICDNPIAGKVIIHSYNAERASYMTSIIPDSVYVPGAWLPGVYNFSLC